MQRPLFVWPITRISVWDLARGYRDALGKILPPGSIRDYRLDQHAEYHGKAMGLLHPDFAKLEKGKQFDGNAEMALRASQPIINEALYHNADHVLMVSAFGIHPAVLWTLEKLSIPSTVMLTESPYDDTNQADWVSVYPGMRVLTNERISARDRDWDYLPHSYDPAMHHPLATDFSCDVLMVGTGWTNRRELLEKVDWTGINLKLFGHWPDTKGGPLEQHVRGGIVDNSITVAMYRGAKIVINIHRHHPEAESIGPRVYEVAACGAFQLSDHREELTEIFGESVPVFHHNDPGSLESSIRYYLKHDAARSQLANLARSRVHDCTFENRAREILLS